MFTAVFFYWSLGHLLLLCLLTRPLWSWCGNVEYRDDEVVEHGGGSFSFICFPFDLHLLVFHKRSRTACVLRWWIVSIAICLSGRGARLVSWLQVAGRGAPGVSECEPCSRMKLFTGALRLSGREPTAGPSHGPGARGPAPGGLGSERSLSLVFWTF